MAGNLLEISNLSKNFGGLPALSRVSFGVETGQVTALIGPSGWGVPSGRIDVIEKTGAVPTPARDGAVVPTGDPPPVDEPLALHAVEQRVERRRVDAHHPARCRSDGAGW